MSNCANCKNCRREKPSVQGPQTLHSDSDWQLQWLVTEEQLAAVRQRFVEIHNLAKDEVRAHEPELLALRRRARQIGDARIELAMQVTARRRLAMLTP